MDTCSLASKLKRKRVNGKDDASLRKTGLNDLPDATLELILSFLNTKCAVQTSVLCKRWQHMWTSLPVLDFDVSERKVLLEKRGASENTKVSKDFVDRVLIFHDAPRIHKFTLRCLVRNDIPRVRAWISAAVRRKPREVDIVLYDLNAHVSDQHMLPHCLFSCEETQVLRLQGCFKLLLPSQICLPRLRALTLSGLTFIDYRPLNLLFGAPALEELVIDNCQWKGDAFEISISAPKLRHLSIEEIYGVDRTTEFPSKSVTISSPELKVFHYEGGVFKPYHHFDCPSSISSASLGSPACTPLKDLETDHLNEVLSALQSVEHLQLAAYFVEAFTDASVPIYKSLSSLVLTEEPVDLSCKELEKMLNKFPRLKTLTFMEGISAKSSGRLFKSKLACLSSTLKRIAIHDFGGTAKELFAVQFLLWKASCLERMDIYCNVGEEEQKEIGLFLSTSHRSSKSCELHVGE